MFVTSYMAGKLNLRKIDNNLAISFTDANKLPEASRVEQGHIEIPRFHGKHFMYRVFFPCAVFTTALLLCPGSLFLTHVKIHTSPSLNWISCSERFQCGNLSVHLDYHNITDKRTASIAITRYLATKQNSDTGTIISNPGGLRGSGCSTYRLGPVLDEVLQGRYNIIGFDPRGINMTLPRVECLSLKIRWLLQEILGSTAPSLNLHVIGTWGAHCRGTRDEFRH